MSKHSEIEYDDELMDYRINGKPFLAHLATHEKIRPDSYLPSIVCQPNAAQRLNNEAKPDLMGDHVAIYLCGACGGYDGNPIGVEINIDENEVAWRDIGFYFDYDGCEPMPFRKVKEFRFTLDAYKSFIHQAMTYQIQA